MIKIKSIMSGDVITISEDAGIREAAKLMAAKDISCLVVAKEKKPLGIINENDLVRAATDKRLQKMSVKDIMHKKYKEITPKEKFYKVEHLFNKSKVNRFLVVENSSLVGLITDTDIVNATRDFTKLHRVMQEVILIIFGIVTFFFLFYFSSLGQALFK